MGWGRVLWDQVLSPEEPSGPRGERGLISRAGCWDGQMGCGVSVFGAGMA